MLLLSIILVLIGLIALAVGIVLITIYQGNDRRWWMWALVIGGGVLLAIGLFLWLWSRNGYTTRSSKTRGRDENLRSPLSSPVLTKESSESFDEPSFDSLEERKKLRRRYYQRRDEPIQSVRSGLRRSRLLDSYSRQGRIES